MNYPEAELRGILWINMIFCRTAPEERPETLAAGNNPVNTVNPVDPV